MKMDQEVFEAFERYQKSSVGCRTEDLLDMGRIYENGCVLKEDCKAAFECYKHAAESEDPEALMELGLCYYYGSGTEMDKSKGFQLIVRSSEMGNMDATARLGTLYMTGDGVRQNTERGLELLTRAVDMGNVQAMEDLANIYYFGHGVEVDQEMAVSLLESAAKNGSVLATFLISSICASETDDADEMEARRQRIIECSDQGLDLATLSLIRVAHQNGDAEEARKRAAMLLDQTNEPTALYDAAMMCIDISGREGDTPTEIELFEKAAEKGKSEAYIQLGFLYDEPKNGQHDTTKAFECYSKAADMGNVTGIGLVGRAFEYGYGAPKDLYAAESWYGRGDAENHPTCQFRLAFLALKGVSERPDAHKAVGYLKKSFKNGFHESAFYLGKWYADIEEIRSPAESVYWFMQGCTKNEPKCMIEMAKHYESGTYVRESPEKALELYERLCDCGDKRDVGLANIGRFYENGIAVKKDVRKARKYYKEAAKDRNAFAMYRLYEMAKASGFRDEAVFWLISSAKKGSVSAMTDLAARYENGDGVPRSRLQAIEWYHRASEKGNRESGSNMAGLLMMEDFEEEPTDYQRQIYAAATNQRSSLMRLSEMCERGDGIRRNKKMAKRWYDLADLYGVAEVEEGMLPIEELRALLLGEAAE
jgi:TPR repeat protein